MLPLVVILGPTAVGKSEIAVELALRLNGEIVSADSVQLYKYINIGTAKLSPGEQKGIPHYFLDMLEPDEEFSVARYQKLAREKIEEIVRRGKLPFLVGGAGLYIQAVIDPYHFPEMKGQQELRRNYRKLRAEGKGAQLYQQLQAIDPETANRLHPNDFRRVSRALEVYHLKGLPISSYQKKHSSTDELYNLAMIGLNRSRPELYRRIEQRVDRIFAMGIVEEVKSLLDRGYLPGLKPLQTLGYRQVIEYLSGAYDLATAIALTKKATRNYAKRQLTWFRRDERIQWFSLNEETNMEALLEEISQYICRNIPIFVE